jgi:cell division protein FtsB
MYSESLTKVKHQRDEIEQLKAKIKVLETEMKLFKSIMKDEVERLQDLLGEKNEDEKVDN